MSDEIVFSYSRAEALADGVLIDVTRVAREAGAEIPDGPHRGGVGGVRACA